MIVWVGDIWQQNNKIIQLFQVKQTAPVHPDPRFTWFQQPVRFEDAMGRILPVPAEYNLGVSNPSSVEYIEALGNAETTRYHTGSI